jgi:hypothetical protein
MSKLASNSIQFGGKTTHRPWEKYVPGSQATFGLVGVGGLILFPLLPGLDWSDTVWTVLDGLLVVCAGFKLVLA